MAPTNWVGTSMRRGRSCCFWRGTPKLPEGPGWDGPWSRGDRPPRRIRGLWAGGAASMSIIYDTLKEQSSNCWPDNFSMALERRQWGVDEKVISHILKTSVARSTHSLRMRLEMRSEGQQGHHVTIAMTKTTVFLRKLPHSHYFPGDCLCENVSFSPTS